MYTRKDGAITSVMGRQASGKPYSQRIDRGSVRRAHGKGIMSREANMSV